MVSAIETEIGKVLKVKRKKGEDEQLFFSRIVTTVQNVAEETWEELSVAAQSWCNQASKAYNKKEDIPGFDEPAPSSKPTGKKAPAAAAKSDGAGAKKKKGTSMYRTIKEIIVGEPDITIEALTSQLKKAGFSEPKVTTIQSVRADTRDTIRVLQDAGCLKEAMLA